VEDDKSSLESLAEWVEAQGFAVSTASSIEQARKEASGGSFDIALVDLQLPDGSGTDLLEILGENDTEIVMITGHGSVDSAVDALHRGARDYLTKPVDLERLKGRLGQVLEKRALKHEIVELRGELRSLGRFGRLVGSSPVMEELYGLIEKVAPTDSTVLLVGETGTGKELVANMVHDLSPRSTRSFVPLNCGAVPPNLIESELFGHEKGSFTGADRQRKGIFERADGGTLFLDEVTETPIEVQVKLLRVLETGSFTRVGGERDMSVHVRLIAATNRNLEAAVGEGKLREDLLYRLNVFPIRVPPLRDRGADVELLANHFLRELNRGPGGSKRFTSDALERLHRHSWPGNVRELRNLIERAFIIAKDRIAPSDLPLDGVAVPRSDTAVTVSVGSTIDELERRLIVATLEHVQGNRKIAAQMLGISTKTLYNKLNRYDLR
jgi:DNA-binding NtrC family response regulator